MRRAYHRSCLDREHTQSIDMLTPAEAPGGHLGFELATLKRRQKTPLTHSISHSFRHGTQTGTCITFACGPICKHKRTAAPVNYVHILLLMRVTEKTVQRGDCSTALLSPFHSRASCKPSLHEGAVPDPPDMEIQCHHLKASTDERSSYGILCSPSSPAPGRDWRGLRQCHGTKMQVVISQLGVAGFKRSLGEQL